jgi:hypothetical protein
MDEFLRGLGVKSMRPVAVFLGAGTLKHFGYPIARTVRKLKRSVFSCGFPAVVAKKSAQPFARMDGAARWEFGKVRADNLVLESLMIAFPVVIQNEFRNCAPQ